MREIKFRAWDGEKMDYDPVCCTDGPEITKLNSNIQSMCEEWHRPKYLALMQYTGLKDKTGKEIYERDIVHVQDNSHDPIWGTDEKHPIVFDDGAFRMDTLNIYELLGWGGYPRALTLEIIGNIYENPELLK